MLRQTLFVSPDGARLVLLGQYQWCVFIWDCTFLSEIAAQRAQAHHCTAKERPQDRKNQPVQPAYSGVIWVSFSLTAARRILCNPQQYVKTALRRIPKACRVRIILSDAQRARHRIGISVQDCTTLGLASIPFIITERAPRAVLVLPHETRREGRNMMSMLITQPSVAHEWIVECIIVAGSMDHIVGGAVVHAVHEVEIPYSYTLPTGNGADSREWASEIQVRHNAE
jgi:hypothetical protein